MKRPNKKNKINKAIQVLMLVLILGILTFFAFNYKDKSFSLNELWLMAKNRFASMANSNKKSSMIEYEMSNDSVFAPYLDGFVTADNKGIFYFNFQGQKEWSESVVVSKPVLRISKSYLVVADLTNNSIFYFHNKSRLWSKTVDGEIQNISINDQYIIFKGGYPSTG